MCPNMKTKIIILFALLTGCADPYGYGPRFVQPAPVYVSPVPPPYGTVYVQPRGYAPGPGWGWSYHPHRGYGWHHAEHGWRHFDRD